MHSSLTRDGVNVFADETGAALSEVGTHYLAGLLAGMPDTALMMNPNVNSYKRIDPEMYTPSVADWGYDNRSAAARVLLGERKSARVEHRRPGADANPTSSRLRCWPPACAASGSGWRCRAAIQIRSHCPVTSVRR